MVQRDGMGWDEWYVAYREAASRTAAGARSVATMMWVTSGSARLEVKWAPAKRAVARAWWRRRSWDGVGVGCGDLAAWKRRLLNSQPGSDWRMGIWFWSSVLKLVMLGPRWVFVGMEVKI